MQANTETQQSTRINTEKRIQQHELWATHRQTQRNNTKHTVIHTCGEQQARAEVERQEKDHKPWVVVEARQLLLKNLCETCACNTHKNKHSQNNTGEQHSIHRQNGNRTCAIRNGRDRQLQLVELLLNALCQPANQNEQK